MVAPRPPRILSKIEFSFAFRIDNRRVGDTSDVGGQLETTLNPKPGSPKP